MTAHQPTDRQGGNAWPMEYTKIYPHRKRWGFFSALFMKNSKGVLIYDKKKFIGAIEIRGYNLHLPERFNNLQKVL